MKVELAHDIVVDPEVSPRTIEIAFDQWQRNLPRYQKLFDYYVGKHDFSATHNDPDQNRIVSNHCKYITDVLVGYQFGNEPRYTAKEGDASGKAILDLMKAQDKWTVDQNIGEDMSIYGRAYELVYNPHDKDEPNSVEIDPLHAFVAYAGDVERDSVFGVVVYSYTNDNDEQVYRLYVYDVSNVSVWEQFGSKGDPRTWTLVSEPMPHGFGRVPLIEYNNNRNAIGDYECILDLQDAYNWSLSDRQDNEDAFAQAMLVLSGSILGETPDDIQNGRVNLKKRKILQVDEDVTAQYLVKQTDEAGAQILQDQYASDMHKFAMVPDLSDEQFAGNASGVAMAYKLFGTDQVVAKKQGEFQKGFTRRCKLYDYRINNPTMNPDYQPIAVIDEMIITFNLNAPQDLSYMATALTQLTGGKIMSLQTARTLVPDIPDPKKEAKLVEEEQDEEAVRTRNTYDYDGVMGNARLNDEEAFDDGSDGEE